MTNECDFERVLDDTAVIDGLLQKSGVGILESGEGSVLGDLLWYGIDCGRRGSGGQIRIDFIRCLAGINLVPCNCQ